MHVCLVSAQLATKEAAMTVQLPPDILALTLPFPLLPSAPGLGFRLLLWPRCGKPVSMGRCAELRVFIWQFLSLLL